MNFCSFIHSNCSYIFMFKCFSGVTPILLQIHSNLTSKWLLQLWSVEEDFEVKFWSKSCVFTILKKFFDMTLRQFWSKFEIIFEENKIIMIQCFSLKLFQNAKKKIIIITFCILKSFSKLLQNTHKFQILFLE